MNDLIRRGEKPVYRFRLSKKEIYLNDLRHAKKQNLRNYGDFVIQKSDGEFVFLLTNIVDDIEQSVSHAIRGEDHLSNSVLQSAIAEALGKTAPIYLHLGLITNQVGKPLSKRDGDFSIKDLKGKSYHPLAIVNYLARLGSTINESNPLDTRNLASHLAIESLAKSACQFDLNQLNFWQKKVIASLGMSEFISWLKENGANWNEKEIDSTILKILQDNVIFISDFNDLIEIYQKRSLADLSINDIEAQKELITHIPDVFFTTLNQALTEKWNYSYLLETIKQKTGMTGKTLFMSMRFIITTKVHGPKLQDLYETIDPDLISKRVHDFHEHKKRFNTL